MKKSGGQQNDTKMKTERSSGRTMWLIIFVCQLGLILKTEAQATDERCVLSPTNRPPENSDIEVICGTEYMDLNIYICPMYQALYNETLMVLNNQGNNSECYGTPDWSTDPPVLRFRLSINDTAINSCQNNFEISSTMGTGVFSDISNVQYVNISGAVTSIDPSEGMITYRPQLMYKFSCRYTLQYLLNNTELRVSGVNIAMRDNNGTFISTLSMQLYEDEQYQNVLNIPETGLNLKTKIYVIVKATNLTDRFNVHLDRCYATIDPYPTGITNHYDLFVGCERDAQTKVELNGVSQNATFSFEAFRFVQHKDLTVSTFYLHCVTRLCEVSACSTLSNCPTNRRRKREAPSENYVSANETVTSPPIFVGKQTTGLPSSDLDTHGLAADENYSSPVVAVIVCIVILAILLVGMGIYFMLYIRQGKPLIQ